MFSSVPRDLKINVINNVWTQIEFEAMKERHGNNKLKIVYVKSW